MFHLGLLSTNFPYILIILFYIAGWIYWLPEKGTSDGDAASDNVNILVSAPSQLQDSPNDCHWCNHYSKKLSQTLAIKGYFLTFLFQHHSTGKIRNICDTSFHPSFLTGLILNRPPPFFSV
ncbi:hypothetical protein [Anaerophaga thermohalophila]|uniref:hypothetical protein n=1 Tax=Anaerophaga thermohalophila TaxID=177400 RepID=UPI000237CC47|nr:hypothetical protein [Anaerophaga thermohalophila]